jgi:3-deoxy-7-phosphoheptulonate synthase/chorismate mutase
MPHSIGKLRTKIEKIDVKLVHLLKKRAEIVLHIGQLKNQYGLPVLDEKREQEILMHILSVPHHPLDTTHLREIFHHIFKISRQVQTDREGLKRSSS